jgi:hypothetical protein
MTPIVLGHVERTVMGQRDHAGGPLDALGALARRGQGTSGEAIISQPLE